MKHAKPENHPAPVYGHRLPAPRLTPWAPFLLAAALSLPVLIVTGLSLLAF